MPFRLLSIGLVPDLVAARAALQVLLHGQRSFGELESCKRFPEIWLVRSSVGCRAPCSRKCRVIPHLLFHTRPARCKSMASVTDRSDRTCRPLPWLEPKVHDPCAVQWP